MSTGYSKRKLYEKLGMKSEMKIISINPPENYDQLLREFKGNITFNKFSEIEIDVVHIFSSSKDELEEIFPDLKRMIAKKGMIWVSWPKKASKMPSTLDGGIVRNIGLENGLVDIKVAAIDEIWSGLKFVYRTRDR